MNFTEYLITISREKNSLLSIGLDVDMGRVPKFLLKAADPLWEFTRAIIRATSDLTCAYKLNLAFYQAYGIEGWEALRKALKYIPKKVIKIADAKLGDIGNSSRMYAKAFFEEMGFDAVTLNPYLGEDSIQPFLEKEDRGAFILCLTSNPGSRDFQFFSNGEKRLFERVAEKVKGWNKRGNCGLVVGATHPQEVRRIREIAPELPLLIPGVGVQGGDLRTAVLEGTDKKGERVLINSSRGIIYSSSRRDFPERARAEAMKLRDQINRIRQEAKVA